ncbi:hypothetical protein FR943_04350 [Mycobacterium sp. TNTM28]|uniref:Secreted protein n=1 Tax=[Mycobacterium] fortunisiensis TaxID=2600579 RepID=A0ABS6KHM2_9MYCO|nr:hypothetical protein [[Mycobacterium] fortunisiensis]MBU9763077.1 hypothetical protein [[Mycobacterium] fortunisiensis]
MAVSVGVVAVLTVFSSAGAGSAVAVAPAFSVDEVTVEPISGAAVLVGLVDPVMVELVTVDLRVVLVSVRELRLDRAFVPGVDFVSDVPVFESVALRVESLPPEGSAWAIPAPPVSDAPNPRVTAPVPSHMQTLLGCSNLR